MNHLRFAAIVTTLAFLLAGCGGEPAPAPENVPLQASLETSYSNALAARSQLLLGTIRLEENAGVALTKEQAARVLPFWRASKALTVSGTASQQEQDAVTNQILAAMSPEQIQAIRAMQLTQADMQTFNQSIGATTGTASGVPGQGQNLNPQERATRQAQRGETGNSGNTAALDYLIKILESNVQ
jgi:hypothetical protein